MPKASYEVIVGAAVIVTSAHLLIRGQPFDVGDSLMRFLSAIALGYLAVGLALLLTWGKASRPVATGCAVVTILLIGALGIWGLPFELRL